MGIVIRQSVKASLVSYVGIAIGAINTLFISTALLSPKQFGVAQALVQLALFFGAFAQLGSPYIAAKFFPLFKNETEQHKGFLFFLFVYSGIGFLIFGILFYFFRSEL
ncbi:MAG: polysaccharide biosynthesis protein, partial [Verrucomicrobia bacterium]|nr:polysaccharide biosynthesis protein [Cytophagales bacterium]